MNHVLEEILRDWAARGGHVEMLKEEVEKARLDQRKVWAAYDEARVELFRLRDQLQFIKDTPTERIAELRARTCGCELGAWCKECAPEMFTGGFAEPAERLESLKGPQPEAKAKPNRPPIGAVTGISDFKGAVPPVTLVTPKVDTLDLASTRRG